MATRVLLVTLFPLLLLARALNAARGRDPLRLRDPGTETYWIERSQATSSQSLFSERSAAEGSGHGGMGYLAAVPLRWLARWSRAPRPAYSNGDSAGGAKREDDLPDEVYTLW